MLAYFAAELKLLIKNSLARTNTLAYFVGVRMTNGKKALSKAKHTSLFCGAEKLLIKSPLQGQTC